MGKSSPSPPSPPDPNVTAQAQAAANKEAVQEQARVNQINQVTPYGNLTYSGDIGSSGRTATTTLSPAQQQMLDLTNQAGINYGQLANKQLGSLSSTLNQPLDLSKLGPVPQANQQILTDTYNSILQRAQPAQQQQMNALETRLANQGIGIGSDAYQKAMRDYYTGTNDFNLAAQNQAIGQMAQQYGLQANSYNQGLNTAIQQRQEPLNELAAMLTGSQVQQPNFVNTPQQQVQPVDIAGLTYGSANLANQQYAQQLQANSAQTQGLYGLLGAGAMAGALAWSDRRLKTEIRRIGSWRGLGLYTWRYVWGVGGVGFMADEVREAYPHAVRRFLGYDLVDYGRLA
jgi:hypothetical protein